MALQETQGGVEIKPHRNTHDYQVVENLSFPIYHPDWGADEEVLLLEAIDQYGLGNWGGIAEHVGGKTAAQCREHYFQVYIDHDNIPFPRPTPEMDHVNIDECIRRARQGLARSQYRGNGAPAAPGLEVRGVSEPPGAPSPTADGAAEDGDRPADAATPAGDQAGAVEGSGAGPLGQNVADGEAGHGAGAASGKGLKRQRHEQQVAEEQAAAAHDGAAAPGAHVATGGRSMHHEPAQQPGGSTAGSKAPRVDSGTDKPCGSDATGFHAKRMEFDPEFDNDAECIVADMEFAETDSPQDVQLKVQMLMLYNRRLDERERRRTLVLERGLLNTAAAQALEKKRNSQEKDLVARMRVFARYQPQPMHEEFVEGLLLEARLRTRIAELREYRRNGIRTFADAEVYDTEKRRQKAAADAAIAAANAVHGQPYGGPGRGGFGAAIKGGRGAGAAGMLPQGFGPVGDDGMPPGLPPPSAAAASSSSTVASSAFDQSRPAVSVPMGRGAASTLAMWRAKRGVPLDITCLPGVELLSARERELCAANRLLPAHYLALKDIMLRDCEQNGAITRQEARTFFRLDPTRSLKIYDLLVSCGWVKGSGPAKPASGGGERLRAITAGGELEGEEGGGGDAMDMDEQGGDE
ncbi:hypothetical protein GPECTOR_34g761 [Gonium pectorale]|uniref:Transcriptional adapter n=1 Tax=Gonium pectorale TaxID=33097 RepID=A0A150GCM7_GONPE|nr:hypothetical protein GPECTOR_34g761 [Gonium pectorale]|eukprot:KXZ47602.1 hypothetical protein GPECTOR_34g761 [Gonium pectorale]